MDDNPVLVEQREGYRVITLNRPQRLNAFNEPMQKALVAAVTDAEQDEKCRALLLTGTGRAFSSGQDLSERINAAGEVTVPGTALEQYYNPLVRKLRALPFPVVCAVNGTAAGVSCNIALACDIVLAARSATFLQPFARLGIIPDGGGTWLLPRLVGRQRAIGLAMTGDKLPAEEAARIGLVWQCVDDATLMVTALALAARLAALPTKALAATRRAVDDAMGMDYAGALSMEAERQGVLGRAHDAREGVAAFVAKRAPTFSDR
jgi:2-(1,2-epoxy-1,2-dihydrophenyl)acetyl-CoA isomerase